jgi:glycosyltransferase involved in cell wall biosynthesis
MNNNILVSIIITTYNRSYHLIKILECLKKNYFNFKQFEIIICDSYSKDSTEIKVSNFIANHNYLRINYLKIHKNLNSVKRNFGFSKACGKFVIFLDDDCYPADDFIKNFYYVLTKQSAKKIIFCGSVKYPKYLMKKKFIQYRQSRHFIVNEKSYTLTNEIVPEKIVTMNMAFAKNNFFLNSKLFNEKFNVYGFEDFEFAYRMKENNFKFIACNPLIYHHDNRNLSLYLKKIEFLGFESMKYLIKLNLNAAKDNNFYKMEKNFFIKNLLKIKVLIFFLISLRNLIIKAENIKIFHSFLYKLALISAYLIGYMKRDNYLFTDSDNKKWYR